MNKQTKLASLRSYVLRTRIWFCCQIMELRFVDSGRYISKVYACGGDVTNHLQLTGLQVV